MEYDFITSSLNVTVIEAKVGSIFFSQILFIKLQNLPVMDIGGTSDPYVKVDICCTYVEDEI